MAVGRMINNSITGDKVVNQLSDDTSRLAFTWLITFADCEGRTYGDPAMVRSMLFPRRQDITIEKMTEYIQEWKNLGLIVWYESNGDLWIYFPKFSKNQPGLRKDREAPSRIPIPPCESTDLLRTYSGPTPDLSPVKLKEVKLKEENENEFIASTSSSAIAENIFTQVTGMITIPITDRENTTNSILTIYTLKGNETVKYLQRFWDECKRRYPRTTRNFWLDWAIAGEIPQQKNKSEPAGIVYKEYEG
jgi:hypothetical protein